MVQNIIPIHVANAQSTVVGAFGVAIAPIVNNIIMPLVQLAFAVALVVFVYGVAQLIWSSPDADGHKKGKVAIWGGLIGIFLMVSAWGIIRFVANSVGMIR